MDKQTLQGWLTHGSAALTGVSWLLDKFDLVPAGYDSVTVAGVVLGLIGVVYGRIRRELRNDGT